jgi:hypothetical protein
MPPPQAGEIVQGLPRGAVVAQVIGEPVVQDDLLLVAEDMPGVDVPFVGGGLQGHDGQCLGAGGGALLAVAVADAAVAVGPQGARQGKGHQVELVVDDAGGPDRLRAGVARAHPEIGRDQGRSQGEIGAVAGPGQQQAVLGHRGAGGVCSVVEQGHGVGLLLQDTQAHLQVEEPLLERGPAAEALLATGETGAVVIEVKTQIEVSLDVRHLKGCDLGRWGWFAHQPHEREQQDPRDRGEPKVS